ncbi:MAG: nucleotidyltransferase family protein [Nitrospirae bacterium]|nr:nucleotidyltransferase family protein [Candidatus Manganitrophaceae bacterium]
MKAMVLAAGFGTRLRPLTDHTPKPLLPVGGRPMIEYTLLLLKKHGITEIIINLHHCGDQIINTLGDGSQLGLSISYSEEQGEPLGTGGGLKKAEAFFEGAPFLVINSDIVIDIDLGKLISFHHEKRGLATLVLRACNDFSNFGAIEIDKNNQIHNILGKLETKNQQTRKLMFTGLHVIEPCVLSDIPENIPYTSIIDTYIDLLRAKETLFGYETKHYWNDLGQLDRYNAVDHALNTGALKLGHIPPN